MDSVPAPDISRLAAAVLPWRFPEIVTVPVALLTTKESPTRLPLLIVSKLPAAVVMFATPTFWVVNPPRLSWPPLSVRPPPDTPRQPALPTAKVPALIVPLPAWVQGWVAVAGVAGVLGLVLLALARRWTPPGGKRRWREMATALEFYARSPHLLASASGLSLLVQVLNVLLVWFVALALGAPVSLPFCFVLMPLVPAELYARLRQLDWKSATFGSDEVIKIDDLVIDVAGYEARVGGRRLELTHQEFELLRFLAQHRGRVFTRHALLERAWGYAYAGGTRTVDIHVRRVRSKLGDAGELIETVRNVGYKLVDR